MKNILEFFLVLVLLGLSGPAQAIIDCWDGANPVPDAIDDCTEAFSEFVHALGNTDDRKVFVFRKITRWSRRPSNSLYGLPSVDMARIGLTKKFGNCEIQLTARDLVLSNRSGKQQYWIGSTAGLLDRMSVVMHQCVVPHGLGGFNDGYQYRNSAGPSIFVAIELGQEMGEMGQDLLSTTLSDIQGMEGMDGEQGSYCEGSLRNCNQGSVCQGKQTRRGDVLFGTLAMKVVGLCVEAVGAVGAVGAGSAELVG